MRIRVLLTVVLSLSLFACGDDDDDGSGDAGGDARIDSGNSDGSRANDGSQNGDGSQGGDGSQTTEDGSTLNDGSTGEDGSVADATSGDDDDDDSTGGTGVVRATERRSEVSTNIAVAASGGGMLMEHNEGTAPGDFAPFDENVTLMDEDGTSSAVANAVQMSSLSVESEVLRGASATLEAHASNNNAGGVANSDASSIFQFVAHVETGNVAFAMTLTTSASVSGPGENVGTCYAQIEGTNGTSFTTVSIFRVSGEQSGTLGPGDYKISGGCNAVADGAQSGAITIDTTATFGITLTPS